MSVCAKSGVALSPAGGKGTDAPPPLPRRAHGRRLYVMRLSIRRLEYAHLRPRESALGASPSPRQQSSESVGQLFSSHHSLPRRPSTPDRYRSGSTQSRSQARAEQGPTPRSSKARATTCLRKAASTLTTWVGPPCAGLVYDNSFAVRGVAYDTKRGTIMKLDFLHAIQQGSLPPLQPACCFCPSGHATCLD